MTDFRNPKSGGEYRPVVSLLQVTVMVLGLLVAAGSLHADTKVVDPSGGGDYTTIQAAINALANAGPRTIVVKAGTYNEAINISAKNTSATNDEQRVILVADPEAASGAVIVDPPAGESAFHIHQSKFITVRGLVVTGTTGNQIPAIKLGGGSQDNEDVSIEACQIHHNESHGIEIQRGNPRTWIINNLIHDNGKNNNSGHGVNVADDASDVVYVVNNTIVRNKFNGVFVQVPRPLYAVNNLIVGNGTDTDPNNTQNKYGFRRESGSGDPTAVTLLHNIFYANVKGDITNTNQTLDVTDIGNRTTSGGGVGITGCTFGNCTNTTAWTALFVDPGTNAPDFHLATGSPAIDGGTNSFSDGTSEWEFTEDFEGDEIPQDGDGNCSTLADVGYDEAPAAPTDADGDGLSNCDEVNTHDTDPHDADTDNDGMPDGWEVENGLNPLVNDASGDPDFDGLTNLQEYQAGTNPHLADTDGDGMPDGWEVENGLNPLVNDAGGDVDGDGLNNRDEYLYGTNPRSIDSDGDGLWDKWEIDHGFVPNALPSSLIVGHWRLDETSGTLAIDSSTYGNDATVTGALHVAGQIGKGLRLDGVDDELVVPNSSAYKPVRLTVGARARFATRDGDMAVLAQGNASGGFAYAFYKTERNSLVFEIANTNSTTRIETADDFVAVGEWYHLVGTFGPPDAAFYVNGQLIAIATRNAALEYTSSAGLRMGRSGTAGSDWFAGDLDDVMVLNFALGELTAAGLDDALGDADNDGLSNLQEFQAGTDPHLSDADNDGLTDYEEVMLYHTNPHQSDTDGDGLSDYDEIFLYGTNPSMADTDRDGLPDGWEIKYSLDPVSAPADNLVGYWTLDEPSGDIAADSSSAANDGIVSSAVSVTGFINGGRQFDGADDGIAVTNAAAYKPAMLSIAAYVSFSARYGNAVSGSAVDGDMVLLGQGNGDGGFAYAFYKTDRNSLVFEVANSNQTTRIETADDFVVAEERFHLVGTFQRPTLSFYVNGQLIGTATHDADLQYDANTGLKMAHGGLSDDGWFAGLLDDVRVYSIALGQQQVGSLGAAGEDDDEDGLTNFEESQVGTNPHSADTDGDGYSDYDEVNVLGTDPNVGDSDADGLPDDWELAYGFDPNDPDDAALDSDGDGLSTLEEFLAGTDPFRADTDGDGLSDGAEVETHGSNPLQVDTDGDGLPDNWEVQHGLNPLANDAAADPDGDSLSNLVEYQIGTDPLTANAVSDVVTVNGADTSGTLGQWQVDDTSIYALDRRGHVEYTVNIPTADIYRVQIEGAAHGWIQPVNEFDLLVSVDGEFVHRQTLIATNAANGSIHAFTPYLLPGTHTVRVFWDDAASLKSLIVHTLRVQSIAGPDADGSGRKDWVETYLNTQSSTDSPATSYTSPACVEGKGRYLSLMTVGASIDGISTNLPIYHGASDRWYGNTPLSPSNTVEMVVTHQNGGLIQTQQITWAAQNILEGGNITIRKGDSLLLTAAPIGATNGTVTVTIGSTQYSAPLATGRFPHVFSVPGTYSVSGVFNAGAQTISDNLIVSVVEHVFATDPACETGEPRAWEVPNLPAAVTLEADARLHMTQFESLNNNGKVAHLDIDQNLPRYVVSRLSTNGPIVDAARADGFTFFSTSQTSVQLVEVFPDGSQLVEVLMIMSPVVPGLDVQIDIKTGGVTFEDGTVRRVVPSTEFDELGQYRARFIRAAGLQGSICHRVRVWQDNVLIGGY